VQGANGVSPELYAKNYSEGVEEDSYEKLLAHEIAQRLHIRISNDDEGRMGPPWFFEGFAIYAVEQFRESTCKPSSTEIREILSSSKRGSYKKYNDVSRFFRREGDHSRDDRTRGKRGLSRMATTFCCLARGYENFFEMSLHFADFALELLDYFFSFQWLNFQSVKPA
jgi:hypothetical protein